jgi:threonine synthase
MMRKIRSWLFVLVILVPLLSAVACASSGDAALAAATQSYRLEAAKYKAAGDAIETLRADGKVSSPQWARFQADAAKVRAADHKVENSLALWQSAHAKPPDYDVLAADLALAQGRIHALLAEVQR